MSAVTKAVRLSANGRAALWYARARGWRVLPLHTVVNSVCSCPRGAECGSNAGKHPRTPNGSTDATTDVAVIQEWWTRWPDAGVAIATGGRLLVIDVDPAKGGDDSLVDCVRALGALPSTPEVLTGGGGRHFYLAIPEGVSVKNSASVLGPGLDVRGDGGYVVAPPSSHRSGQAYAWEVSSRPEDVPVAEIPAPWLERINRRGLRVVATAPGEAIGEGKRNETLFSIARGLRARGLGERAILAALLVDNDERCSPPLDPREVEVIAGSACRVAPGLSPEYQAAADAARARRAKATAPVEDPNGPGGVTVEGNWQDTLVRNKRGVLNTFGNLCKILRHAPEYAGKLRLNMMSQAVELDGAPLPEEGVGRIRELVEDNLEWGGFSPASATVLEAVRTVASERRYHPVQEYLTGLQWDGVARVGRVAAEILGASTAMDQMQVGRWMVAAARRALQPGCKVDTALVLVGPQGRRKSTFFSALGGRWFADTEITLGDKDTYGQIHWSWIYELGELDHVTSARHAGQIKQFLSRTSDLYRPPYGRVTENFPRSCVIVGSTNEDQFLNDPTGSRRFWVVRVGDRIDLDLLAEWRDQLWAEAVVYALDPNVRHWFDAEEDARREIAAEPHRIRDPWEEVIATWISDKWPEARRILGRDRFTMEDVLGRALDLKPRDMTKGVQMRAAAVLGSLRYVSKALRVKRGEADSYRDANGAARTRVSVWIPQGEVMTDEVDP